MCWAGGLLGIRPACRGRACEAGPYRTLEVGLRAPPIRLCFDACPRGLASTHAGLPNWSELCWRTINGARTGPVFDAQRDVAHARGSASPDHRRVLASGGGIESKGIEHDWESPSVRRNGRGSNWVKSRTSRRPARTDARGFASRFQVSIADSAHAIPHKPVLVVRTGAGVHPWLSCAHSPLMREAAPGSSPVKAIRTSAHVPPDEVRI